MGMEKERKRDKEAETERGGTDKRIGKNKYREKERKN
jgi:hypothetical protein